MSTPGPWGTVDRITRLLTLLVRRLLPKSEPKSANPVDVAIAVSSSEAARKSSEATEAAAHASRRKQD